MNWKSRIRWKALLSEIRNEQCVLVIGPDLVQYDNDRTLFQLLCEAIQQDSDYNEQVDLETQYMFEHEELLQLQPNGYDTDLFNFLEDFYATRTEFDAPFAQLAQLPFHLVISLLPDTRLYNAIKTVQPNAQFGYYPVKEAPSTVVKPTKEAPLVYNILGTLDYHDTVVTFDHLFAYLQGILGTRPLPVALADALKRAKSFVFLGVHFEKWYMQVLLRVFLEDNENKRPLKYSLLHSGQNRDACTFIARRLELDFYPSAPLDFLDELRQQCKEGGILRKPQSARSYQVFVSYSHQDKETVNQLEKALEKRSGIKVIMDDHAMTAGDRIQQFMERVAEMNCVIAVLSEHSLRSPYVGRELTLCLEKGIRLLPCHLDKRFLDKGIVDEIKQHASRKILEINTFKQERIQKDPLDDVRDLNREESLWRDYARKLPELFEHLQGCKSVDMGDFDAGMNEILNAI